MFTEGSFSRRRLLLACLGALALPAAARAALSDRTLLRRFAAAPFVVPRTRRPTQLSLDVRAVRVRIAAVAASPASSLVLRLADVRVERPPRVVWRVYLAPPGTSSTARKPFFVGSVALFGAGVGRSAPAAVIEFRVDAAVSRSLRTARGTLELTFVPSGPLVDGEPTAPVPAAALRVGRLELWSERL